MALGNNRGGRGKRPSGSATGLAKRTAAGTGRALGRKLTPIRNLDVWFYTPRVMQIADALWKKYYVPLVKHGYVLEDVVQDVWISYVRAKKTYAAGRQSFGSWLNVLAERDLISLVRKIQAEKRGERLLSIHDPEPGSRNSEIILNRLVDFREKVMPAIEAHEMRMALGRLIRGFQYGAANQVGLNRQILVDFLGLETGVPLSLDELGVKYGSSGSSRKMGDLTSRMIRQLVKTYSHELEEICFP